jgi:hypothetical protein
MPIYHITHINNLSSILNLGGLVANSRLKQEKINYQDIAYGHIQDRRGRTPVPCSGGGYLHDYVPFYFAPRSPMLYAINKGTVSSYQEGQNSVIYLVTDINTIEAEGLDFAFTDGHAAMDYTSFFTNLEDLEYEIDWDIMEEKYWRDTDDDPDRKRRRQAEFLVYRFFPWQLIHEIGVINAGIQARVKEILQGFDIQTPVKICSQWYY